MSAIREAITMSQEASDHTCLQHVLSLMYRTVESEEKQRLMERCIGKCGELSLSYLSSLGILSLSQHTASTGSKPGVVLELLTRSDVLNCQHSMGGPALLALFLSYYYSLILQTQQGGEITTVG